MHDHDHHHEHTVKSAEEALALLQYMAHHNHHHAEELHELAHNFSGEVEQLLHEACHLYEDANEKVDAALALLKKD